MKREWRFAALTGLAAGLALAPVAGADPSARALGIVPVAVIALRALRPRRPGRAEPLWLALIGLVAALAGLLAGGARLHAIDAGALLARPGTQASVDGFVAAVPRRDGEEVSVRVDSAAGRILLVAPEPVGRLAVGSEVRAEGSLVAPEPWREAYLRRQGIAMLLRTDRIDPGRARRGGFAGWVDGVRNRAEAALGRGIPDREAALARGFVLGEDDRIDHTTREDFRRTSLTHLLAVSGENVILLCVLAWPLLAVLGLTLRARLIGALCLIAIYVPVTGAGPSIQRAGVMGAAGLVAALADRPRSRWYAVLLAAAVTLAINPRAEGDVGWQLSFAAVVGIMLWAKRLVAQISVEREPRSTRRALAEAVAVTLSATVATAPLMAAAFDQFSPASLPANVLAAPAVAPAMWLGMLTGILGQLSWLPVEPINWLDSLCLAYISQIAHWLAKPDWALLAVHLRSVWEVMAAYAALVVGMEALLRCLSLRRARRPFALESRSLRSREKFWELSSAKAGGPAALVAVAVLLIAWPGASGSPLATAGLTVRVLDVGQGDSILLQPPNAEAVLVDTGPPGDGVEDRLHELGVERLAAVVVTHDQSDHAGELGGVLGSIQVERVIYGHDDPRLRGAAVAAGAQPFQMAEGAGLDFGGLHLAALWPPRELLAAAQDDPNRFCLVLVARWRHFSMLLTGDAEAEDVPMDPGPIDVLKVSHHGSEDAGLGGLLERSVPRLAVISVGEDNGYGHPSDETLSELGTHDVPALRTDEQGEIEIEAGARGWTAAPATD